MFGAIALSTMSLLGAEKLQAQEPASDDIIENYSMSKRPRSIFNCRLNSIDHEVYYVVNAKTGEALIDHGGDIQSDPASMTKLMTLMLVHEAMEKGFDPNAPLYFSKAQKEARSYDDRMNNWGPYLRVKQAVLAAGLGSYNDATFLLAENVAAFMKRGNTETDFVKIMNERAQELGMEDTYFATSNGMPVTLVSGKKTYSTPKDMAILMQHIIDEHPDLAEILQKESARIRSGGRTFNVTSTNSFARTDEYGFEHETVKTGVTCNSGFSATMYTEQGEDALIISYFGGKNWKQREIRMAEILKQGFDDLQAQRDLELLYELF